MSTPSNPQNTSPTKTRSVKSILYMLYQAVLGIVAIYLIYIVLVIFFPQLFFIEYMITSSIKRNITAHTQNPQYESSGSYHITYLPGEIRGPYEEGTVKLEFVKKNYDEAILLLDDPDLSSGIYSWGGSGDAFTVGRYRVYSRDQLNRGGFSYLEGNVADQQFPFDKTVEELKSMIVRYKTAKQKWQEGLLPENPQKYMPLAESVLEEVEIEQGVKGIYVSTYTKLFKEPGRESEGFMGGLGSGFLLFEKDGKRFEFVASSRLTYALQYKPETVDNPVEYVKQELLKSARSLKKAP